MSNSLSVGTHVNKPTQFNNTQSLPNLKDKSSAEITTAMWGIQPAIIQEISNINRVYKSKHGMFASIPILCRGNDCAYKDTCMITPQQRTVGQRCPMEIAAILSRYEQWCSHFDIDTSQDIIAPQDLVDATLIKDLVNIEVQMIRAENKIALNGDFMSDTLLDIDKKCNPYYGKVISSETEFLMTLQDKKIKLLNQLNATRKDKASDKSKSSASDAAIRIFQQVQEMERHKKTISITEIQFGDDGNVIDMEESAPAVQKLLESGGEDSGVNNKSD